MRILAVRYQEVKHLSFSRGKNCQLGCIPQKTIMLDHILLKFVFLIGKKRMYLFNNVLR